MIFALIRYGPTTPGTRPSTRLSFIMKGQIQTWDGHDWMPCAMKLEDIYSYKTWARQPTDAEVCRVQQLLEPGD